MKAYIKETFQHWDNQITSRHFEKQSNTKITPKISKHIYTHVQLIKQIIK